MGVPIQEIQLPLNNLVEQQMSENTYCSFFIEQSFNNDQQQYYIEYFKIDMHETDFACKPFLKEMMTQKAKCISLFSPTLSITF